MHVEVGDRWQPLLAGAIHSGRFTSAEDVVNEGLRLVAEQEAAFATLKLKIERSLERGGANTTDDVRLAVETRLAQLDMSKLAA